MDEDNDLWESAMRDVKRLSGRKKEEKDSVRPKKPATVRETVSAPRKQGNQLNTGGEGLDRRTDERLRRGQMDIEGRIDLHGFRQKEAQEVLIRELLKYHAQGKRCILVITGQGKEKKAENEEDWWETKSVLLRKVVPEWLKNEPLADIVLQTHTAKQQDGGAGALYVLLRRKRNNLT